MSLYKQFKTDEKYEVDGINIEYGTGTNNKPITFRIARAGGSNQKYLKLLESRTKPYRRQLQNDSLDLKVAEKIFLEVFVDSVLLGWENVEDAAGVPLAFTRDNAIKVFTDLPDLYNDLREQAAKSSLFRAEIKEVDAKN